MKIRAQEGLILRKGTGRRIHSIIKAMMTETVGLQTDSREGEKGGKERTIIVQLDLRKLQNCGSKGWRVMEVCKEGQP